MTVQRLAPHNVVGIFPTFAAASEALDALVAAGFDTRGELSLLGPDHEMRPAVGHIVEANGEGASGTGAGVVKGGATGGAVGTVVTTLGAVAAAAIPGVGLAVGPAALIGAASGATAGSTVGGLLGLDSAGRRTEMWQQTLSPFTRRVAADHVVLVAAHVDEEDRAAAAREVLDGRATEVHQLEADVAYEPLVRGQSVGYAPETDREMQPRIDPGTGMDEGHGKVGT